MITGVTRRLSSPTFIGRHQERAWLGDLLAEQHADHVATILIGGEAGVGKTRLVTEFAERAAAGGWRVLVGHCLELGESGLPFAPIVEAFRDLPDLLDPNVLARVLASGRAEIGNLVPTLADGSAPAEARPADEATQARLYEFILAMIGRLAAEAPLVLEIEDLHWADRSTRDLLRFLARNVRRGPLLIVATFRTDELHRRHPLVAFLAELGRLPRVERSDLSRLRAEETREQLSSILGHPAPPDLARGIHERSDGNPFFAEELLAAVQAPRAAIGQAGLPPDLETLLGERLDRLTDATQTVLEVAAAAGRDASHVLLERIGELSNARLLAALREAIEQQVLVLVESENHDARYSFRHALIQEAIYGRLLPTERLRLHRRIVDALLDGVGGDETAAALAAEVAHHADRAADPVRALHWSVVASDAATAVGAFAEAYLHLERALHHWSSVAEPETVAGISRIDLLGRAASAAAAIGEPAVAAGLATEAIELLGPDGDAEQRAMLENRRFFCLWESGDLEGAAAAIERAVREIPTARAPEARIGLLVVLANARIHQSRYDEAEAEAREAHMEADRIGDTRAAADAWASWGFALCFRGSEEAGIQQLSEAMPVLAQSNDDQAWLATSAPSRRAGGLPPPIIAQSHDPEQEALLWWFFAFGARCGADEAEDARAHARPRARPLRPRGLGRLRTRLRAMEQPIDEAYARFRQTEAMLGIHGDRQEIAALLRAVHATSTSVGARPLATDVEALARRARISLVDDAGATPAGHAPDPWNLTGREREVLGLLAIGLTNREIGERLFVTEKTASVHVSNILGKLGVHGRGAAAAIAVRLGVVPAEDSS